MVDAGTQTLTLSEKTVTPPWIKPDGTVRPRSPINTRSYIRDDVDVDFNYGISFLVGTGITLRATQLLEVLSYQSMRT